MPDTPATRETVTTRAVNAIRALTIDATQAAGDGHPGMPLGAAPMGYVLYVEAMRHDPSEPRWPNRDRYVQSAGHGSMLQYALLHLTGYDLPMEELRRYRQWGSLTPGHPEHGHTVGVETTTGPLGQGISTAVGMAMAEAHLAARYNRPGFDVVDHRTYVIASDGDLMEGVSGEASSLAGHLGLGKLIVLYDDNRISIDGGTDVTFTEDVLKRYEAYGWHVQRVEDGNDVAAILRAVRAAEAETARPSLVAVRTVIGYGAPNLAGTPKVHGSPLGAEEAQRAKEHLGIDWPEFTVPDDVLAHTRAVRERGQAARRAWEELFARYEREYPQEARELRQVFEGRAPDLSGLELPRFEPGGKVATRKASEAALNAIARALPSLLGGSADLAGSNFTDIAGERAMARGDMGGRIVRFGVREHAMGAIANGLALHGLAPFVGTFLVFSDYLRPALRLAALMRQGVIYVFTHDSIGLGGDGPTHQPVEHLASLRYIPNNDVWRPCDAVESAVAWRAAIERREGPSCLVFSRQNLPHQPRTGAQVRDIARGGYVLKDSAGTPEIILIATGSEVALAMEAAARLGDHVRVVSMPSTTVFDRQDEAYRESVLPKAVRRRVAIEAGVSDFWRKYVGLEGAVVGMDTFGASAPADRLFAHFGFTVERVVEVAKSL